jgi:hypothetical protein
MANDIGLVNRCIVRVTKLPGFVKKIITNSFRRPINPGQRQAMLTSSPRDNKIDNNIDKEFTSATDSRSLDKLQNNSSENIAAHTTEQTETSPRMGIQCSLCQEEITQKMASCSCIQARVCHHCIADSLAHVCPTCNKKMKL